VFFDYFLIHTSRSAEPEPSISKPEVNPEFLGFLLRDIL